LFKLITKNQIINAIILGSFDPKPTKQNPINKRANSHEKLAIRGCDNKCVIVKSPYPLIG
jgi:hypothetical protein